MKLQVLLGADRMCQGYHMIYVSHATFGDSLDIAENDLAQHWP